MYNFVTKLERMKLLSVIVLTFLFLSCKEEQKPLTAQNIVDKAIQVACNGNCDQAKIEFTFRDNNYVSTRKNGLYTLEKTQLDSTGLLHDILNNNGFKRFKNDTLVTLVDSVKTSLIESVNSVHYFAQLPYGLNAPAVRKELVGEATIKGKDYYEVEVRFSEEGGGTDFEDVFMYWINKEEYTVDYLAYKYAVNGGGVRFREAYNPRVINGIRFVDYNNFKPDSIEVELTNLDQLFEEGKLQLLSKIEIENMGVELLKTN
jgi:hypothetical protein